ncbi:Wall-associated receptor kinase-like 22 [Hordeum vulgare]|nr:Wall-associated receptor kinase-like 22 [Hordeum vulgare]
MAIHTVLQLLLFLLCCVISSTTTMATTPLAARASVSVSGAPGHQQGIRTFPSANCPNRCGNKDIKFPFGIGPGCSRQTGFELICDNSTLYLRDHVSEVIFMGDSGALGAYIGSKSYN